MSEGQRETIKVSHCHHGTYEMAEIVSGEGENKTIASVPYCNICKQPCEIVELLVEEK